MSRSAFTRPEISVVAPVHNEIGNLEPLIGELVEVLDRERLDYELLFVDDSSNDGSLELLTRLAAGNPRLRVLGLASHGGQSAALAAGLERARGAVVATIDADGQNLPRDLPRLLAALEGHDLVSGVRVTRHDSLARRLASRVANRVRRLVLGDPFTDVGCSLKVYRAEFVRDLPAFVGMHRFLPILALGRGARATEIAVGHRPRVFGKSHYGAARGRLLRGVLDVFGVRWLVRRGVRKEARELGPLASSAPSADRVPGDSSRAGLAEDPP